MEVFRLFKQGAFITLLVSHTIIFGALSFNGTLPEFWQRVMKTDATTLLHDTNHVHSDIDLHASLTDALLSFDSHNDTVYDRACLARIYALRKQNYSLTQTESHLLYHHPYLHSIWNQSHDIASYTNILKQIIPAEQAIIQQGNFPLMQTSQPDIVFLMDAYTRGWEIVHNTPCNNYLFTRFFNESKSLLKQEKAKIKLEKMRIKIKKNGGREYTDSITGKQRKHLVFLNSSFFMNIFERERSCTALLFFNAKNSEPPIFATQYVFNCLGKFAKYYTKYQDEIEQLKQEHALLCNNRGVILLFSFTQNAIEKYVVCTQVGGYPHKIDLFPHTTRWWEKLPFIPDKKLKSTDNVVEILTTTRTNITCLTIPDRSEFCFIATDLGPNKGVEIQAFYDNLPEKITAYYKKRDALWQKIKNDYQHDFAHGLI